MKNTKLVKAAVCIALALLFYFVNPIALEHKPCLVLSIAILMIALWVTESMPMPVVALLPLIFFPLTGVGSIESIASSYANPVIFLFMGGFMLGLAIEKWNLHRRIALSILNLTGASGNRIILGFILATGAISMWLSNTATTMMMFPIALSVIQVVRENRGDQKGFSNFSLSVMIAIALSSNFGGIATIIGTPPNVAYAAFYQKQYQYTISFFDWMKIGLPLAILLLMLLYLVLVKWLYPNYMKADNQMRDIIHHQLKELGPLTKTEKRVLIIFISTAFLWISKDLLNLVLPYRLDDNMIALIGAVSLFLIPSGVVENETLLNWDDTKKMAWGILLLFGGGIALASTLEKAGLISMLGTWFTQFAWHPLLVIFLVTLIAVFVSEVMSNVAQVIVFAPVVSVLAESVNMHPLALGIPMTLAASCASMLPMGTPPNAIAFSSGYIKLSQMTRVGFVMNLIAIILITLLGWLLVPVVFKV